MIFKAEKRLGISRYLTFPNTTSVERSRSWTMARLATNSVATVKYKLGVSMQSDMASLVLTISSGVETVRLGSLNAFTMYKKAAELISNSSTFQSAGQGQSKQGNPGFQQHFPSSLSDQKTADL